MVNILIAPVHFLRERKNRRLRLEWAPEIQSESHLFDLRTMIESTAHGLLHAGPNILQSLVRKIHADHAESRMIEIENNVDR